MRGARRRAVRAVTAGALVASGLGASVGTAAADTAEPLTRVTGQGGARADGAVAGLSMSQTGSVAFSSAATNLVDGDTNGVTDVFVRSAAGDVTLVSRPAGGGLSDRHATAPVISANGRYVAFAWAATNASAAERHTAADVYVVDLDSPGAAPVLANPTRFSGGTWSAGLFPQWVGDTGDVVYVGGPGDANYETGHGVYRRALDGTLLRVSPYNRSASEASATPDGRWIVYSAGQVYRYDTATGRTDLVSVDNSGYRAGSDAYAPEISADGRLVAYTSGATNLPASGSSDLFVRDMVEGWTTGVALDPDLGWVGRNPRSFAFSADGRRLAFEGYRWSNPAWPGSDIYVHDLPTGTTLVASVDADGAPSPSGTRSMGPALSPDGSVVAFQTTSPNLVGAPAPGAGEPALPSAGVLRDLVPLLPADTVGPQTLARAVLTPGQVTPGLPAFTPASTEPGARFECAAPADSPAWADCPAGDLTYDQFGADLLVRAVDLAGNADPTPSLLSALAEGGSPNVEKSGYDNPTRDTTPSYSFDRYGTFGGFTLNCRVDGGAWVASCGRQYTLPALADGTHAIDVRAVKAATGRQSRITRVQVTVDTKAPAFTLTPVPARTTDDTPTVKFGSPSEPVTWRCAYDEYSYGYACTNPYTREWSFNDGAHFVTVIAEDAAGNETRKTTKFVVDKHKPQTDIWSKPSTTTDRTPTFRFSSNETGSTFTCRIDGGAWTACKSGWTSKTLKPGKHTFSVRAKDLGGSVDPTPATKSLTVR